MSAQLASKGAVCSRSCLDYLLIELVHHYSVTTNGPCLEVALDAIGASLGAALMERCSREHPPMALLDIIKFICKEFWTMVFGKAVDNLRTNHRGTYLLRDVHFSWLSALHPNLLDRREAEGSAPPDTRGVPEPGAATSRARLAEPYARLPSALLRGALTVLGLDVVSVTADLSSLPQADFTIVLRQPPPGPSSPSSSGGASAPPAGPLVQTPPQ